MNNRKLLSMILSLIIVFSAIIPCYFPGEAASSAIASGNTYYIKNKRTGKYLTATSASSGANIKQSNFTGSNLQKFILQYNRTENGYTYYSILCAANTAYRFDVVNASDTNNTNIGLFVNNPSYYQAQCFRLIKTNSGTINSYRIMPCLSTQRVLSIESGSLLSGKNVELYSSSSSKAHQDWIFENVTYDRVITNKFRINAQDTDSTCGCACVRNILSGYGLYYSETTIKKKADTIAEMYDLDYTYVRVLTDVINYYLDINNKDFSYVFIATSSYDNSMYELLISLTASYDHPFILNGNYASNTYVPYSTTGHYVVCNGIKENASGGYTVIVSDPYKVGSTSHAGIWEMPLTTFKNTNHAHSSGGFIITAEFDI